MTVTELEKALLMRMLADPDLTPTRSDVNFDAVVVTERRYSGVGFFTELASSSELKLFAEGAALRWGKVGARLNEVGIETGYLVYVDNGYVTGIEGYTYGGEPWPDAIRHFALYEI